ncbi:IS701 family transposase domain protein [Candidatus Bealeia paramacronuclearis]|uniref:IS701 family transposase domain protein n=1 Tax=Candidatus Bealeia paramacronuclearis TaxID=1921001 RepID=A0ABZ2C5M8_9PROT
MKSRWKIEVYHRELKQTCGLERCQSRTDEPKEIIYFLPFRLGFKDLKDDLLEASLFYQQQWDVIKHDISREITKLMSFA